MAKRGEVVAITPTYDTKGKRDATRAFIPEAKRFAQYWEEQGRRVRLEFIDNRLPRTKRRKQLVAAIGTGEKLRHLAIFSHATRRGIQFGFDLRNVAILARRIALASVDDAPIITLYSCSTAEGDVGGDGGFADELRDALCVAGLVCARVDGHSTRGHTTRNPFVRRFEGEGSATGGQGGRYIVRPRGKLWRPWKAALRDRQDPLRYRISRLEVAEVHDLLGANA